MNRDKHKELALLVGRWKGKTRTWFEAGKLEDESTTVGKISPIGDGRFFLYEYASSFKGERLEGAALLAVNVKESLYEMAWVDSFHTSLAIMFCQAEMQDEFSVSGSYFIARDQPRWGWRTVFSHNMDTLTISQYNETPDGVATLAVETILTRVGR